jgi:hypothetical protein
LLNKINSNFYIFNNLVVQPVEQVEPKALLGVLPASPVDTVEAEEAWPEENNLLWLVPKSCLRLKQ